MAKIKEKEHTGFRNRNLFCFYCGGHFIMPKVPIPVTEMISTMKSFSSLHKKCLPVWKAPDPDLTKPLIDRIGWWTVHGEQGLSSQTIWCALAQGNLLDYEYAKDVLIPPSRYVHPSDPDDFRRCYLLLKAIPEWKSDLHKLKMLSPIWSRLVDNWDNLTNLLEEQMVTGKQNGMYELMESLNQHN